MLNLHLTRIRLAALACVCAGLAGCATPSSQEGTQSPPVSATLPPLPETVTSFGAVTADGWLYAFGGHKGERHEYSVEMVSGSFQRLRLSDGRAWETLPASTPGQGLTLVAHGSQLYRIGGMAARNHEGQKQDLYSLDVAQRFDPGENRWENIAPLPLPRSSHDAAVSGEELYVAGGWSLKGGTNKAFWCTNALAFDLAHPDAGWKEFPQPFQRRALALAALNGRVYCIGGMDSKNDPSRAVDIYETTTGKWSKGPDLPKGEYNGFACSAITQDGWIYVTMFKDELLRLSRDGHRWETVGRLKQARMAHRLVTAGKKQLIVLGGENGEEDKLPGLELLTPAANPIVVKPAQTQAAAHARQP